MGRPANGQATCGVCDTPDLKIIGTVTVTGKGLSGSLKLAVHTNPATGRACRGMESILLVRMVIARTRR